MLRHKGIRGGLLAVIILAFVVCVAGLVFIYNTSPYEHALLRCPIYAVTGLKCPGCGLTRALYCLLHLDFADMLHENPFILIVPYAAYLAIAELLALCTPLHLPRPVPPAWVLYTVLGAWLLYGIGRNFVPFL